MPQIRPYELIQTTRTAPAPRGAAREGFERLLGAEFEVADPEHEGVDLEYVAAELACRRNLARPELSGPETYPVQTAYFLRHERKSEVSPMRALRLGGVLKAAEAQRRNGLPATGTR